MIAYLLTFTFMIPLFSFMPVSVMGSMAPQNVAEEKPQEADMAFLEDSIAAGYRGEYRQAIRDLEDYLADYPVSSKAWAGLARLENICGHFESAEQAAEKWLGLQPEDLEAMTFLAGIQKSTGRYEESEENLRKALALDGNSLRVRASLARLLFFTGRREAAGTLAKETIDHWAGEKLGGDGLCDLSRLYDLTGDLDRAARAAVYADHKYNGPKGKNYSYSRYEALLLLGDLYRRTRLGMGSGDQGSGNRALDCYRDALR
ncbi:MAG: tetratricopeptide repeat protein, partial [Planctomycetes bacterium]|nr:tetratricopeptide repeat protein [Planctomycetota bacterium]